MSRWLWPCPGNTRITSGVGPRWQKEHKGIDISAPKGAAIIATRSGKVITAVRGYTKEHIYGNTDGGKYGNHVYIDHQDGYISRYAHMTNVRVSVGDRVNAGDVIGTVGSTGSSTGYHLHFEIRKGSNYLDPEEFVNPANSITVDDSLISGDIAHDYTAINTLDVTQQFATDTVVATRTSEFTNGAPIHAYIKLYIGDYELEYEHGKPNIIQRFEINRLEEAGCTAQFILFDENWDEIETQFSNNMDNISVQYGYSGGVLSDRYRLLVQDYSIEFTSIGTLMSVKAISLDVYENLIEIEGLDTGTKNPGEAIKAICQHKGWTTSTTEWAITKTVDREENYKLNHDSPITYIQDTIIPEAMTQNGEIVTFNINASDNTARLKVKSFENVPNDIRTYVYQKGYDSVVLSVKFDIKGIFGGTSDISVATGLQGSLLGLYDKKEYNDEVDQNTVATISTGLYTHTNARQSIANLTTAGETAGQMRMKLEYYIKKSTVEQYEATMTIIGDPSIQFLDYIRIINMTELGYLHHTSGIYIVKGITDTIEGGMYTTSLILQRNGDIADGTHLINPRAVVK